MTTTESFGAVVVGITVSVLLYSAAVILGLELKARSGPGRHRLVHRHPDPDTARRINVLQDAARRDYTGRTGQATGYPEAHPTRPHMTYSPVCWTACGTPAAGYDHAPMCLHHRKAPR